MVVNESTKANRSVRPKLKPIDGNNAKSVPKTEKKHRLKQRFEVIKKLGQGTYGKVQLAINKETGQEVAIKTIKKSKVESEQDLIRIRREIQIMSSIQHPHIIHIYEVFENKDKIVLVMQYASGGEVYEYVSHRKVLSDTEARRVFRQIATAIYYCHKNKICHRDLKLENILLDEKGNAKIADFGLSNVFDEKHFLQTFCGSPLYASPEIVKGSPYYGPEVDCWSLGVLLYTLVYGAMPFDGSNFKKLVKQISESNYFEPKQKSEASDLIKRLLAPNPTQRATIIDICTDWWVNQGYEHSLLQVSEDMANLTPVRLEILLALAPVSPSADKSVTNPFSSAEVRNEETNDKTNENINNSQELVTDINETESTTKKRLLNPSFDQNMSAITTQRPKKKKSKNESKDNETENIIKDQNQNVSETIQMANDSSCDKIESKTMGSNDDQNKIITNVDSNITKTTAEANDGSDSSTKTGDNVCQPIEGLKAVNEKSDGNEIKDETNKIENKEIKRTDDSVEQKESKLEILQKFKDPEVVEKLIETEVTKNENNENTKLNEESEERKKTKEIKGKSKDEEKKKTKPERRLSTKRPGKLSIPNLWNKSLDSFEEQLKLDNGSRSQIYDAKSERKVPFIPLGFRVSDAKRAFERRCSVPANNLLHSMSAYNKLKESESSVESEEKKTSNPRQRAPKLNIRSMSMNEILESPIKVQQLNDILQNKEKKTNKNDNQIKSLDEKSDETNVKSQTEDQESQEFTHNELISTPVIDKNMAKDILKKTIAKAKLMEKRQNSTESIGSSPVTTPLVSIENSDVSIVSEPSFFRIARPFAKEESDKPAIETDIKIEVKAKSDSKEDNNVINKTISSGMVSNTELDENKIESPETKSAPIARSYKKVTFTKDGACITETGKIYSSEGTDGSYTRVEKKSKVTHFPTIETQPKSNENSVQRSDSHSSSGSLDIFDDIFDNHWCGDEVIFPNMKSLLQGVMGNRKSRRRPDVGRSRAESCERNASDWFGLKKNPSNLSDQEVEDDDYESFFSRGLRPTSRANTSLFDKSVFSRHFKDIDKEFGELDNSYRDLNRSISRDRSSFSSRIHPSSFKIVFGPQTSVRTNKSSVPFETEDDDYESASMVNNSRSRPTDNVKTWSREPERSSTSNLRKIDSFDSPRKRVEQWLQSDNCDDDDEEPEIRSGPLSMYATIGPRGVRRYLRTMSGRSNDRPNIESGNSSSSVGLFRNNSQSNAVHSIQSATVPNNSVLEMRFSLNPTTVENNSKLMNTNTNISESLNQSNCETSDFSDEYQSSIALPESSSLLEQLRTHGYRNIVSQRLSGSSLFSDLDSSLSEIDKNYKRGKSVLNCSSDIANENENACECMGETNLKASSSATTSEASVATDINANNNETKASESLNIANRIDFTETISETLNNCLNQQSCESTSRRSARNLSNNSKTTVTDDLPECNPTLKPKLTTNKSVNFKESVQERIHRKSFYSRFNDDRPVLTSRHRRRSFIDSDDVDIAFGLKSPHLSRRSSSFRNSLSLEDNNFMLSKPPSSSSDWFTRMESKASQLMDDLLNNDRMFSIHSTSRQSSENDFSFNSRRRSSSTTRSALSTPLSYKSDFDPHFNSISNNSDINGENDNQINSVKNLKSSEDILQRAIDILSKTDSN